MTGIKEMLLKEQDRLEKILSKTRKQVKDAPPGSLRPVSYTHLDCMDMKMRWQ